MINNVTLVGRITKDPELRYTPSGIATVRFTLAVNRTFSNQSGEREADFIQCVAWRKAAENLANFQHKGNLIGVEGRIQTGNYEGQDGKRVFTTDVVANAIQFLESKAGTQQQAPPQQQPQHAQQQNTQQQQQQNYNPPPTQQSYQKAERDPFVPGGVVEVSEDDLPF